MRPWWLLGLPLALALFWAGQGRRNTVGVWEAATDAPLLAAMAQRGGFVPGTRQRRWPALLAACFAAVALAGPAAERAGSSSLQNLDAVLLVADLSERDASDAGMAQLRFTLRTLLESAGTRQTGLIIYAGDAYSATALTSDPDVAGAAVAALEADTVPDPGARPDLALALAGRVLKGGGQGKSVASADIVLVSKGAGAFDAQTQGAAVALRDSGYRLHTLHVQAASPSSAPGERRAALAALAQQGGGLAVEASDPGLLTAELQARPVLRWRTTGLSGLAWRDYGPVLLVFAALASLALFRRRAA